MSLNMKLQQPVRVTGSRLRLSGCGQWPFKFVSRSASHGSQSAVPFRNRRRLGTVGPRRVARLSVWVARVSLTRTQSPHLGQGGAEISSKMCNISNCHGRARKARLGNLRSEGYEMGLAKGRGFSAKQSGGHFRVGRVPSAGNRPFQKKCDVAMEEIRF